MVLGPKTLQAYSEAASERAASIYILLSLPISTSSSTTPQIPLADMRGHLRFRGSYLTLPILYVRQTSANGEPTSFSDKVATI